MADGIATIRKIGKTYRHIARYRKILQILLSNGYGFLFKDLRILNVLDLKKKEIEAESKKEPSIQYASRLRSTLAELGPTFVKLGQILSCRPDILPANLVTELAKLRDRVPPFPFEKVREAFKRDFNGEIEDFFQSFDETPVGAASIAQGHKAILKNGQEVFVKIQRPDIKRDIDIDLEILQYLAQQIEENNPDLSFLKPTKIIEEFAAGLEKELDFENEVANMTAFGKKFEHNNNIVVPKPIRALCSKRILTMDFISGFQANDLEGMRNAQIDLKKVANMGAELIMQQFFENGIFHADPHPGNVFILPGPKICYIDFGDMGRLTQDEMSSFSLLLSMLISGHIKPAVKVMLTMTTTDVTPDLEELERDVAELIDCYFMGNIMDLDLGSALQDFYAICYRQRLCLKPNIYKMLKALGYVEAMGLQLAPDFEILSQIKPYVTRQTIKQLSPKKNAKLALELGYDWLQILKWLPNHVKPILGKIEEGTITINHNVENLQSLNATITHSINRLCAGIILCGMIVTSGLLIHAKLPPAPYGCSIFGLIGLMMSSVLALVLLVSIFLSLNDKK